MATIGEVARPQDTCAQCGTTAFPRSSMVGNLCPDCDYENKTVEATTATVEAALAAQRRAAERRANREVELHAAAEDRAEVEKASAEVHDAVSKVVSSARTKAHDRAKAKASA